MKNEAAQALARKRWDSMSDQDREDWREKCKAWGKRGGRPKSKSKETK